MKKAFILCGLTGWCMEILWTGLHSILSGELTMTGKTSVLKAICGLHYQRSSELPGTDKTGLRSPLVRSRTFF